MKTRRRPLPTLLRAVSCVVTVLSIACAQTPAPPEAENLRDVPRPDLSRLSETVRSQLQGEREALDVALGNPAVPAPERAERFGQLGRSYHAYGLTEPAFDCYANAEALDPSRADWPYLAAVLHQERGAADDAAAAFEGALAQVSGQGGPGAAAVLVRLADVRIGQNRLSEADDVLRRLLADDPDSAAAHHGLGRVAAARDDFAAAVRHFERTLELQPAASIVHYVLAQAYRGLGDAAAAERHVARRGARGVSFPDPLLDEVKALVSGVGGFAERAVAALGEGRYDDAMAEYRRALAADPENPTALRGLGLALRTRGDLEASVMAYRDMLERYPDHTLAHLELATVLMERGSVDEAITEFHRALALEPEFKQAHFNLGVALTRAERWPEAEASFEKVLEIDDRDHMARYQLAVVLDEIGRRAEAFELVRRVAAEDPGQVKARQRHGHYLAERGDLDGAVREHRAVLGIAGAPDQEKALAHYQLGRFAKQRGDNGAALEHFGQAVDLFPELWVARISLANTLRDLGRHSEAVSAYRQVLAEQPGNLLARLGEAQALMREGRFDVARRRLEEGLEALPKSAELGHLLARLLATAPRAELRDGQRSLELASQIFQTFPTLEHAETVVMAMAEQGRFDEAVDWQEKIILRAEREGRPGELPRLRDNLARYRRREPARNPSDHGL